MVKLSKFSYFLVLFLTYSFLTCASPSPEGGRTFTVVTDNDWLQLQNLGFQIQNGAIVWTTGGNWKVDNVVEVDVQRYLRPTQKVRLFRHAGTIPKGNSLIQSHPLRGAELDWFREPGDTQMVVEILLKNRNGETRTLLTPVAFSAAAKNSTKMILNAMNSQWDK